MIKKCPICGGKIVGNIFDNCLLTIVKRVKKAEKEVKELKRDGEYDAPYNNAIGDCLTVMKDILKKAR